MLNSKEIDLTDEIDNLTRLMTPRSNVIYYLRG